MLDGEWAVVELLGVDGDVDFRVTWRGLVGLLFDGWVGWERMAAAKVLDEMSQRDSRQDV